MFEAQRTQIKSAVKVKTKSHLIFNIVFSALLAVLANPVVVTGAHLSVVAVMTFWVISFLSIMAALTFTKPIWKSVFWFYKIAVFACFSKIMYALAGVCYANYTGAYASDEITSQDISFWFTIWLAPLVMIFLYAKVRNVFIKHLEKTKSRLVLGLFSFFETYSIHIFSTKSEEKKKLPKKSVVCVVVSTILFFLGAALLAGAVWTNTYFRNIGFAAVIFNLKYSPNAASSHVLSIIAIYAAAAIVATLAYLTYLLRRIKFKELTFFCADKSLRRRVELFSKRNLGSVITGLSALVCGAVACIDATGLYEYAKLKLQKSSIYEDYYAAPTAENVIFPENKRNLVYIYLESMENTFTSYENGGNYDINYIPELTQLAAENINFSHNGGMGGQNVFLSETAYTMGSTVAQTAGVALVTPMGMSKNEMDRYSSFLPGLTTLEDILHENGYNQLFIRGEDTTFAGYSSYVDKYDNSTIFDYCYARNNGYIPEDYFVHWGFEDAKLFDFVREQTLSLAEQDAPFCITLYTADTHGNEGGYECEKCEYLYDNAYSNSIDCSSKLTYDYISWLKQQDFYENTTIILYGDHLSELPYTNTFIKQDDYVRTTYNCIINSAATPVNEKNRTFCAMDMFPTTLSAIGAEIKGDRLGLGTDLFSSTPTLCEELGADEFVLEIQKRSDYYNENFWLLS